MRRPFALLLGCLAVPTMVRAADLLADAARADVEVEERVHAVLAHGLIDDWQALQTDVASLQAFDERLADEGLPRSGLIDNVRYLGAALVRTRDGRRTALEQVLAAHPDPVVRRLTEHRLETGDTAPASPLLATCPHNRRAPLLNAAVRSLRVFYGSAFIA